MWFIECVLLQRLVMTLEGRGEMCLLQGSAPSGVYENDVTPSKSPCTAMHTYRLIIS